MTTDAPKTLTFELEEPVTVKGKTYTSLTLRRCKGRDLLIMDKVSGELTKTIAMFASMADVPMGVFEEMDADDFQRIGLEAAALMGKSARKLMAEAEAAEGGTVASPE